MFLRVAAARRPVVRLPEGEIDLRERLPERLLAGFRAVSAAPPPESLAAAEGDLLRLCALVVEELADPESLPFRDGLWLTYRLFQWLCAQLDALTPDERQAGIAALRAVSPAVRELAPAMDDLLNPFRFERGRFDHRLATVLYALSIMEAVLVQIPAGAANEPVEVTTEPAGPANKPAGVAETGQARSATSTALEDMLAALAARPLSDSERALRARDAAPSCLDWPMRSAPPLTRKGLTSCRITVSARARL